MATALLADVDEVEREAATTYEPGEVFLLPLPLVVYRALSNAAAKKNKTVAQLLARALTIAIEEP
jgi:hypothetical protein